MQNQFSDVVAAGIKLTETPDPEERLVVVTQDDIFKNVRDILFRGDLVYPNDPYFDLRFGDNADLNNLEEPETSDKFVVAIVTPTHVRAGVSLKMIQIPENNNTVNLKYLPGNILEYRKAPPQTLENPGSINVIMPYAITNLFHAKDLQNGDNPEFAKGAGNRLVWEFLNRVYPRYVPATGTPARHFQKWCDENMNIVKNLPLPAQMLHYMIAQKSETDKNKTDWGQALHQGLGAYAGNFTEMDGIVVTNNVYSDKTAMERRGLDYKMGFVNIANHLLAAVPEMEDHYKQVRSAPSDVKIDRTKTKRRTAIPEISSAPELTVSP